MLEAFRGTLQTVSGAVSAVPRNTAAGRMLTVTLINDLDGTVCL